MASFGKLTDYFNRRKSREELRVGRSSRRSGSYCCTVAEARSLERKLQRPLLAKSRTLPSIPQSPTVSRVHHSDLIGGSPPRLKNPPTTTSPSKACTLPPAGELWRLEDDMEGDGDTGCTEARLRSQSPFSHFQARAAYLRKSVSADDHLDMGSDYGSGTAAEGKPGRGSKGKLKRKFSLGSADRKENQHKKSESGISKFTHRLSLKERPAKAEKTSLDRPPSYRRRSLSVDWADSSKMTQPMRGDQANQPASARKSASLSSPSAARRLYRNLSGKFRVGTNPPALEDSVVSGRGGDKERLRKTTIFQSNEALFEAVEHQELDLVQLLLSQYSLEELDLNTPNSEGLLPLDIAIMTNNVPMAKLLLRAGAKESPHFVSLEGRAVHLATLVQEADQRVLELQAQVRNEGPAEQEGSDRERQLKAWEWRLQLFRRMQTGFEHAKPPDAPSVVRLSVSSSSSLKVDFQEPLCVNSAVVTKYKVSWSSDPSFSPLLGEMVVDDTTLLQCSITGLTSGSYYYVRVSSYNMKGWGPPLASTPACSTPSSWRDIDGRAPRQRGQKEALDQLLGQIKEAHRHCICHEPCKAPTQARKHSVSKSLRHLFQPTSKFVKTLKRGLYLTSILYRDDNILVTPEDQIPIVEIEDSYSSSLMQDFLWFTKVSYLWEDISWLQQCLSPSQSSCSCTLQTRLKMLQAVSHLQGMLGTQDLGQVYYEPIKDKHGNALLVLLKDMNTCPNLDGVRWTQLCKLQLQRKSISSPEEPTALDILLITLSEKLAYHRRSRKLLSPGLYLGYLKLCTSVEQIRALVPQKLPNVLCHTKIRDNSNVSREEWQWLQALSSLEESLEMDHDAQSAPHRFLQDLRSAIKDLMAHINIAGNQVQDFRIYSQEVLEFGDKVSFLLLLPPSDEVCTAPGQNNPYSPRSGFLTLPLQIFELVHFNAYCPGFIGQYCRVSALLELESLMSQQALREAFSEAELLAAKKKHQQVQEHIQQMEEVWRDARWIMDALQYARYKQPTGGISISWIIDLSKEVLPEKPPSTSSQLDFMPSPMPSPEPCRKHSDFAGLSDEEGSSEVFLTTDSDYDSSRAQSPRELDLLPPLPPLILCPPGALQFAAQRRERLGRTDVSRRGRTRRRSSTRLHAGRPPGLRAASQQGRGAVRRRSSVWRRKAKGGAGAVRQRLHPAQQADRAAAHHREEAGLLCENQQSGVPLRHVSPPAALLLPHHLPLALHLTTEKMAPALINGPLLFQ
ncbi:ankyrin repeat and fibronectin type-III domain-containing protein 1 isoform X1 [Embiotoca jacksoni]|uniref:ankyrin repeat and fibronectin type-III domain-containing protein 1 isoform X1 n=2 Tax=Embiotoca jacksoni TaxID=100190 RepID=UPI0037049D06